MVIYILDFYGYLHLESKHLHRRKEIRIFVSRETFKLFRKIKS